MTIKKTASAHWTGPIKEGKGSISTESKALSEQPFGFNTRFEGKPGTNPEELIGAAHAGCFSMALSLELGKQDFTADSIDTKATVSLIEDNGGFTISAVHLDVEASIPGIDNGQFQEIAEATKKNCPVSKVLNADITMNAHLK
ncbi:OsmC family protein [Allohahella marinimesophila]|uniref:OsmC family protein n=1 Tax=Allohahella marinimesophila TaxID=1054972 RepID=A0ABP7NLF2_9GAMM